MLRLFNGRIGGNLALLSIFFIFLFSFTSALEIGNDGATTKGVVITLPDPVEVINYSLVNTNNSIYWGGNSYYNTSTYTDTNYIPYKGANKNIYLDGNNITSNGTSHFDALNLGRNGMNVQAIKISKDSIGASPMIELEETTTGTYTRMSVGSSGTTFYNDDNRPYLFNGDINMQNEDIHTVNKINATGYNFNNGGYFYDVADGTAVGLNANYLYLSGTTRMYSDGIITARGGIGDDGGDLDLNDNVRIFGSALVDNYLNATRIYTGSNTYLATDGGGMSVNNGYLYALGSGTSAYIENDLSVRGDIIRDNGIVHINDQTLISGDTEIVGNVNISQSNADLYVSDNINLGMDNSGEAWLINNAPLASQAGLIFQTDNNASRRMYMYKVPGTIADVDWYSSVTGTTLAHFDGDTGFVGFGNQAPSTKLEVTGDLTLDKGEGQTCLQMARSDSTKEYWCRLGSSDDTGFYSSGFGWSAYFRNNGQWDFIGTLNSTGTTWLRNTNVDGSLNISGSVVIGSASPISGSKLEVKGIDGQTSYLSQTLYSGSSGNGTFIQFTDATTYNYAFGTEPTTGDFAWYAGRYGGVTGNKRMTLSQSGNLNVTGNLYVGGNVSFKRPHAMFSSTETQTMAAANTPYPITFNWTEDSYQITKSSDNANFSFGQTGAYLIELSPIFVTDTNNKHVIIWVQKNGVNVPRSGTKLEIPNAGTEQMMPVYFNIAMNITDKFRVMMMSDDAGSQLLYSTNTTQYDPEVPSIIMTISKVSEVTS